MANLMAYPSAAGSLSQGLQSGIQLGLAMRKQREDEDNTAWQKQKFQEQQEQGIYVNNINKYITMMSSTNSTIKKMGAEGYLKTQEKFQQFSGMDADDIKKARESLATIGDNVYGDIVKEGSGALTHYNKTKDFAVFKAGIDGLHMKIAQTLSGAELTQGQSYLEKLQKEGETLRGQEAEKTAMSALSGSPVVAGYEDKGLTQPITVMPTEEDINQTLSANLPLIGEGALKKQIAERAYPKPDKDIYEIKTLYNPKTNQTKAVSVLKGSEYTPPQGWTLEKPDRDSEKVTTFDKQWAISKKIAQEKFKTKNPTDEQIANVRKKKFGSLTPLEYISEQEDTEKPATYSKEDLEFTAKKYGITVDEVKKRLGVK